VQCYNCRGITNYDPNECFIPTERTILQECDEHEVCEVSQFIFTTLHYFSSHYSRSCDHTNHWDSQIELI